MKEKQKYQVHHIKLNDMAWNIFKNIQGFG